MEPHMHGNNIQQRWFESKAMGKVISGLGWHYKPVEKIDYSMGQLVIHKGKNKIDP